MITGSMFMSKVTLRTQTLQNSCFFSFFAQKMLKMTISTSVWSAQHPNTRRNIQQLGLRLFFSRVSYLSKSKSWNGIELNRTNWNKNKKNKRRHVYEAVRPHGQNVYDRLRRRPPA